MLKNAKMKPLSHGRWLVALDDTLYMLDARWHIRWRYRSHPSIIDFVATESNGFIYGIAEDEVEFILDMTTGKKLWSEGHIGRAFYSQIVPYGKNGCLMIINASEYRVDDWLYTKAKPRKSSLAGFVWDNIIAYRGTDAVWTADWPPDAELLVNGKNFYAVTKTDKSIYVRRIHISRLKKY